ncbi:uncharacterized protein LOC143854574 isoform X1 [Tasmannia lanceolata]|uniref:uncharacterized protein LOC143854574 isoform X1 n=1 Tax=Tasmannia lanceolata TaxID=3420 RepID=UPI0040633CB4
MTSILSSNPRHWSPRIHGNSFKSSSNKVLCIGYPSLGYPCRDSPFRGAFLSRGQYLGSFSGKTAHSRTILSKVLSDDLDPGDEEDDNEEKESPQEETGGVNNELFRKDLERIVGKDDSAFTGIDLATLIRNKYGRSYDVQLIKKEFMGRNLLAMNVMWKYMEQRSFPLTEEEYLLRLDDVANTLKCWGAVSHIRNSLAKLKERPRIGKAVSIFIDMDETGGRANEWIYK